MKSIVMFCMPQRGHFQRLQPIISGLVRRGSNVVVMTSSAFKDVVESSGAAFIDLFATCSIERIDQDSLPVAVRFVSFAGFCAEKIIEEAGKLRPCLIVYDTFAYIGYVVARALDLPYVNVCAGHNLKPQDAAKIYDRLDGGSIAPVCYRSINILQDKFNIDAHPFAFLSTVSPHLNIYCEPKMFLRKEDRAAFEPIMFFGSIADERVVTPPEDDSNPYFSGSPNGETGIFVSFGTIVWRYFAEEAFTVLKTLSRSVSRVSDSTAVISLGGHQLSAYQLTRLNRRNVRVSNYVDQWKILGQASVFITHHGLNSTHEAIYHRVPMISYPFFADQPALAGRCQELELAVPLAASKESSVAACALEKAMAEIAEKRSRLSAALETAREWECEVIAGRPAILDRINDLCR